VIPAGWILLLLKQISLLLQLSYRYVNEIENLKRICYQIIKTGLIG
jgi:hypothetical protein